MECKGITLDSTTVRIRGLVYSLGEHLFVARPPNTPTPTLFTYLRFRYTFRSRSTHAQISTQHAHNTPQASQIRSQSVLSSFPTKYSSKIKTALSVCQGLILHSYNRLVLCLYILVFTPSDNPILSIRFQGVFPTNKFQTMNIKIGAIQIPIVNMKGSTNTAKNSNM